MRSPTAMFQMFQLIRCPKRRWGLRDPAVGASMTNCFRAIAEEFGFWIDELTVEQDHVHEALELRPKYVLARVVGILKSISASRAVDRLPELRGKFWSGELWK